MTEPELADLADLLGSGQARLLRRVAGVTLAVLAARTGASKVRQGRYEAGGILPRDEAVREAYYRILCRWREAYGTVELAAAEPSTPRRVPRRTA